MKNILTLFCIFLSLNQGFTQEGTSLDMNRLSVNEIYTHFLGNGSTTLDVNEAYNKTYEVVDKEFNRIYQLIMTNVENQDEKDALREASRAWLKFRDSNCNWVYMQYVDGSTRHSQATSKKIDMTMDRINELKFAYKYLFSKQLSAEDIIGTWEDLKNKEGRYEFYEENGIYKCKIYEGESVKHEGLYSLESGRLKCQGINGSVYLVNEKVMQGNYGIYLHELRDFGGYRTSLRRIESK